MKNIIFATCLAIGFGSVAQAQSVAINTDGSTAAPSSILDVKSTDKGVLIPRMTSAQRSAIAAPATGLMVYDTTFGGIYFYNGTAWTLLNNNWTNTGNAAAASDVLGTTNAQPLRFMSNNAVRGLANASGQLVWGATSPQNAGDLVSVIGSATLPFTLNGYSAQNGSGVWGEVLSASSTSFAAIQGTYNGSGTGNGVLGNYNGTNTSTTRAGVYGVVSQPTLASGGAGVYGFNNIASGNQRIGVLGAYSNSAFGIGVHGIAFGGSLMTGDNHVAVVGWRANNQNYSGYFNGNHVIANGTKSASVPTSKGNQLLYCVESPEVWFEDLGTAQLVNGEVEVQLDPLLLETVRIDDTHPMHVFVQPQGECEDLYVVHKKTGFIVKEKNGGTSNVKFSYKIMAKRFHFPDHRFGSDAVWGEGDTRKYSQVAPKKPIDYHEALKQQKEMDKNWKPIPNPAVTYPQETTEGANNRSSQKQN